MPTDTANEEEGICSNWGSRRKGKFRLTRWFQLIAQVMACCVDKGRLSGPSEDEKFWHVKHSLWSTAIYMWQQLISIVATIVFNHLIKKKIKRMMRLVLKTFLNFHWFYLSFWQWRVSWWGNISFSWAVLLTVLRQTLLNLFTWPVFGGSWN